MEKKSLIDCLVWLKHNIVLAGLVHRNCTAEGWTDPLVPHEDACYTFNDTLLLIREVSNCTR